MKHRLISAAAARALLTAGSAALADDVRVYNWSDYIDESSAEQIRGRNRLELIYDVFDSNEVLETKMLAGGSGYDVVVPSGTFLQRQISAGAFQKLDMAKLPNHANMWDVVDIDAPSNTIPTTPIRSTTCGAPPGIGVNVGKVHRTFGRGCTN